MSTAAAGAIALTDLEPTPADFRTALLAGLSRRRRRLPCRFFYDERGSALFDEICTLPEYYPTRTELGILEANVSAIAAFCGPGCLLVELGSGNSRKVRLLLDELDAPAGYVPIEISRTFLLRAATALAADYPGLEILPVCADYAQRIALPEPQTRPQRSVVFFPGSTIGNFAPRDATKFLRHVAGWCEPGDRMLVGVDLDKPRRWLEPAYNDARGVTAAFNLNVLVRANAELGANFRLDRFFHRAVYNARHRRIEMHLVSACAQAVDVDGRRFHFRPGEAIVTEYSYKHRPADFEAIACAAGWNVRVRWTDPRGWFGVFGLELAR